MFSGSEGALIMPEIISISKMASYAKRLERAMMKKYGSSYTWSTIANHARHHILEDVSLGQIKVTGDWKATMRSFAETIKEP
jgi:hypothetical protein